MLPNTSECALETDDMGNFENAGPSDPAIPAANEGRRPMRPPPVPTATGRLRQVADWEVLAKDAYYSSRELAALCEVSVRHLQRHFRTHYSLKLGNWLSQLRLAHAYQLLLQGHRVKEVAFSLGFKQLSHFSREFKKYHSVTPSTLLDSTWPKAKEPFVPRIFKTPASDQLPLL